MELSWPSSNAVTEIGRGSVQVQAVLFVGVSDEAFAGSFPVMHRKSTGATAAITSAALQASM
jgi:hypothetical protein